MTVIRNNSISGINSITAQSSALNFYDSTGNTLAISADVTGGVTVATGATISGSTNTITASTNGSERLRIHSSGKVGINTDDFSRDYILSIAESSSVGTNAGILINDTDGKEFSIRSSSNGLRFRDVTSGNDRLTVDTSGNVQIANGNLVFSTSGTGIDFSATSDAAGMTSELLDDYEEGTWTPTISFNGNATGVVYSQQDGHYVKIGSSVTLSFRIGISNKGSSTGNLRIEGLPFRPGTVAKRVSGVLGEAMGGSVGTPCFVRTESSSSFMSVIKQGTGSMSSVNNSDFTTFDNYGVITFQI